MQNDISSIREDVLLKSVLDTVSDGVTVIDRDLKIVFYNEAIRKNFGDITGRLCYEAYRKREEPCVDCLIFQVMEDGKQRKVLRDTVLPDGTVRWMECAAGALKDSDGQIIGAVEIVRDVTKQMRLSKECATLKREVERQARFENIITQSKRMKQVFTLVEKVARTNSSVLITGESGTGKELIARAVHQNSGRSDAPFVPVNCSAIPESLFESEIFGHVKGSFTGATRNHKGLIPAADGGTLFLDEVGEIPLPMQVKLLRFLQEGTCRRIGDTESRQFDVRVVSATNRDLEEAIHAGLFREDLYFRLNVIPVFIPSLRERREDIPLLASHFLQQLCDTHSRKVTGISPEALKILLEYRWLGNIRELQNAVEYALHLTEDGQVISGNSLPASILRQKPVSPGQGSLSIEEYTKQSILALQREYNEEEIARRLGISRKNLWEKRKRWDLPRPIV